MVHQVFIFSFPERTESLEAAGMKLQGTKLPITKQTLDSSFEFN